MLDHMTSSHLLPMARSGDKRGKGSAMNNQNIETRLLSVLEELAAVEHERWSHWQKYVHSKCSRQADGSLLIPLELVVRWERQISLPYDCLNEQEKESDREQVHRYLPVVKKALERY